MENSEEREGPDLDAVVVGAGFSGLYLLHRLRQQGLSVKVIEAGGDVGGTWYWNRYPGARCDIPTTDYTYSFDSELEDEWQWSEKYATQLEILAYLNHVTERYHLRPAIQFATRVEEATWDDAGGRWMVRTSRGEELSCRYLVMATGCLSVPKKTDIAGADRFQGEAYFTGRWPHDPVDFNGKRVAVIGTGSSGIQSIPMIAEQAASLVVFQRTASFSMPAGNGPRPADRVAAISTDRESYRQAARESWGGVSVELTATTCAETSQDDRHKRFEAAWQAGQLFSIATVFADQTYDLDANEVLSEMFREKIRSIVNDPQIAEDLCPHGYPFGTKRPCLDTGYFETFNLPHVRLVNLRRTPIRTITEFGLETTNETFPLDAIVYATGFDALTGPLTSVDIRGRDGLALAEKWAHGPSTYLGITAAGFPNLFMVTGPGSPSVLTNMVVAIEQHVEWVARVINELRDAGLDRIEPTPLAEEAWTRHVQDCGELTLFPKADSWYMGANIPGKPRVLLPYTGGVGTYGAALDEVVERSFLGFTLSGPTGTRCNDGVIRPLQPDVALVLDAMASTGAPPLESMTVADARALVVTSYDQRPSGPPVASVVDDVMVTTAGSLPYRLYRPASPDPLPIVVYFHGGGWVLGDLDSDDPFCRDLCVRTECAVLSVNYRHAPEARFPAAADDALTALEWVAEHGVELGLLPDQMVAAGWSSGGNLAAVACQRARDAGGPVIAGQVLIAPVTDAPMNSGSYATNAAYVLTPSAMKWFWDNYAGEQERLDPKAAPLRGALAGLPPTLVMTAQFDPLHDEGRAYAEALSEAGVPTSYVEARGHIHNSLHLIGIVKSAEEVRAEIARAIRGFVGSRDTGPVEMIDRSASTDAARSADTTRRKSPQVLPT